MMQLYSHSIRHVKRNLHFFYSQKTAPYLISPPYFSILFSELKLRLNINLFLCEVLKGVSRHRAERHPGQLHVDCQTGHLKLD